MSDFYGDNINRFWFGLVRNNNDGLHLGRVKVRIAGIHGDGVRDRDLPWAQVILPSTEPGVNGLGQNPMLAIGAQVFGVFIDGKDSQLPLVLGSVPRLAEAPQRHLEAESTVVGSGVTNTNSGDAATKYQTQTGNGGVTVPKNIPGSANQEKAFNFFSRIMVLPDGSKLTQVQSAGIVGNLMVESGISILPWAFNKEGGNYGARGIAQWRGERWENMVRFARTSGVNAIPVPSDYKSGEDRESNKGWTVYYPFEFQLAFIEWEFKNYSMGKTALKYLRQARTVAIASYAWQEHYEVNFELIETRKDYSEAVYKRYGS
tara:strand:+ start:2324 stop:3274 length:951 start_codon:yes stop_codon:yes gene_type:complete